MRLSCETTARLAIDSVLRAIRDGGGRSTKETDRIFSEIRFYLHSELPTAIVKDVLDVCLARDRFRCHHNPTDCLALELWRVFFSEKFSEMSVSHHAFAFPKTTNYPDIVLNLGSLLSVISATPPTPASPNNNNSNNGSSSFRRETRLSKLSAANNNPVVASSTSAVATNFSSFATIGNDARVATITSFKLELKQCDVGCYLQVIIFKSCNPGINFTNIYEQLLCRKIPKAQKNSQVFTA